MTAPREPEDAWQTDVYLERLLAAHARDVAVKDGAAADDAAGTHADAALDAGARDGDPAVRAAADALERRLIRFHPSFRFEEALAARLRTAAERYVTTERRAGDSGRRPIPSGAVVPFRRPAPATSDVAAAADAHPRTRLFVGGAIASGVSLAGAAFAAWRRTHPSRGPIGGAARAVRAAGSMTDRGPARRPRLGRVLRARRLA